MENTIDIKTFPITEDMYQLKSIDIINSNFVYLKNWHDEYKEFCKMNDENSDGKTRLYFENVTSMESDDIKTSHIQSIEDYNPSGVTNESSKLFEISGDLFKWKSFIIDSDGMTLPTSLIHPIYASNDVVNIEDDIKEAGKYVNGFIYIIVNCSSVSYNVTINSKYVACDSGKGLTLLQWEGSWYIL